MKRTFKYPVYPTRVQEAWLFAELKHQKRLQNYMLQMRSQMWEYGSISVSMIDQINHLKKLRENNTYYSDHPQDMQVSTIKRVNEAKTHFFRRCKDPKAKKKGHPKFKRSVRSVSWSLRKYTLKSGERVRQNPIRETGTRYNRLKVPTLGEVKIRQHRRFIGDPKEVTLKKTARGWYCFIVCEVPDTPKCVLKSACGADVGNPKKFVVTSDGEKIGNRRFYKRGEPRLAELQRELSRKQKGSQRYWKTRAALAKHHDKIACQRLDFIAKTAYKLFHHKGYDAVVVEDLHIKSMIKGASRDKGKKGLAKSISDTAWGMFFDWCKWVAKRDGKHFHTVDPAHTSKTCSHCCQRVKGKMSLSVRTFECKHCGFTSDRDHNAALNILYRAACALRDDEFWATLLIETRSPLLLQACWG